MKYIILITSVILFMGCSHQQIQIPQASNDFEETISRDFVKKLSTYYPPAQTTINFNANTALERRIEQKLRDAGYGTLSNKNESLTLKLNQLGSSIYSVVFTIQRGSSLSRAYYSASNTNAFGSWTAINMPKAKYAPVKLKRDAS